MIEMSVVHEPNVTLLNPMPPQDELVRSHWMSLSLRRLTRILVNPGV